VLTATKSPKKTKKLLTNVLIGLIIVLTATENVVENKKAGAEIHTSPQEKMSTCYLKH
jgi:hypothetical protein